MSTGEELMGCSILMPYSENWCLEKWSGALRELAVCDRYDQFLLSTLIQSVVYSPNITGSNKTYMMTSHICFVRIINMNVLDWQKELVL